LLLRRLLAPLLHRRIIIVDNHNRVARPVAARDHASSRKARAAAAGIAWAIVSGKTSATARRAHAVAAHAAAAPPERALPVPPTAAPAAAETPREAVRHGREGHGAGREEHDGDPGGAFERRAVFHPGHGRSSTKRRHASAHHPHPRRSETRCRTESTGTRNPDWFT